MNTASVQRMVQRFALSHALTRVMNPWRSVKIRGS
jgi:hypothetical protein